LLDLLISKLAVGGSKPLGLPAPENKATFAGRV